nr:gamma-butyrobetaine hydroxylase-like domain-containing protein [Marinicella sp. W31]MDC2876006.1 gamma-butyrobetaine hydroxylase-like domain-containing protein [Marinicella sp. W31]
MVSAPTEIRVSRDRRTLTVSFEDDKRYALPAEMLRVLSPSAEVKGHGPGQAVTVPGKRNVGIMTLEPAGNYAILHRL